MQEINLSTQRLPLIYPRRKKRKRKEKEAEKKKKKGGEKELTALGNLIGATSISEDVSAKNPNQMYVPIELGSS